MAACDQLSRPACAALDPQQPQIILLKEGTDTSQGKPQLVSNINACMAVADTVRTTLGPRGMDKLIHNDKARSRGDALTAAARRSSQSTHDLTTALTAQMRAPMCFQTHILLHTSGSGIRGRGLCRAMQVPRPEACMHGLSAQGQVTISNDGATIMKLLEIVHPAAKSLVDVSLAQDAEVCMHACMGCMGLWRIGLGSVTRVGAASSGLCWGFAVCCESGGQFAQEAVGRWCSYQCHFALLHPSTWAFCCMPRSDTPLSLGLAVLQVGDGTTSVVILAAEFLKEAKPFVEEGVHPRVRGGAGGRGVVSWYWGERRLGERAREGVTEGEEHALQGWHGLGHSPGQLIGRGREGLWHGGRGRQAFQCRARPHGKERREWVTGRALGERDS